MSSLTPPQSRLLFKVSGMDCGGCAATVRTALEGLPGTSDVEVSLPRQELQVTLSGTDTNAQDVRQIMERLGFDSECLSHPGIAAPAQSRRRLPRSAFLILAILAILSAYLVAWISPEHGRLAFSLGALAILLPIARRAVNAARMGAVFTIQMLMTIAAVGAVIIGEPAEAAFVVLFFLMGEMLEGFAARKARSGMQALAQLLPDQALVEDEKGRTKKVTTDRLRVGQIIVVRAGDRIAADGIVLSGTSSVDESTITGESIPVRRSVGARVCAGTVNHDATLRVRVDRESSDNTVSRIIALVQEAQSAKAPTERFIDRFSRIYMPVIIAIAVLVAVFPPLMLGMAWQESTYRGLALLLIGCPCALVISVPAAIAASLADAARNGALVKGGAVIETLAQARHVLLDKTGTLTVGRPHVTDFIATDPTRPEALSMAAALERESTHPLAMSIVEFATAQQAATLPVSDARILPGQGMEGIVNGTRVYVGKSATLAPAPLEQTALEAEGKTVSVILLDGKLAGLIAMRDEARQDAKNAITTLQRQGLETAMLTGDNHGTASAIANGLGVAFRAGMLPADKAAEATRLSRDNVVVMIGDGVNDAPALAAADVGIAIGSGTDVAIEAADAVLISNRLGDLPRLLRKSRDTMAVIRQNVAIALGLKLVFLVTTITGVTGLWPAILADTGATVLVTLNSVRLLRGFGTTHP